MDDLGNRDRRFVWHPFTQVQTSPTPIQVVKAKDTLLITADGKEYLDVNSSWWVNVHGHGKSEIGDAIRQQFDELDHVIFADVTHSAAVELAENIVNVLGEPFQKVFFSDNGSTANEVALKMAIQYWHNAGTPKRRIMALDGAYHGDTFGAMAVGQRGFFNVPFEPFFFDVDFLDFPCEENEAEVLNHARQLFGSGEFAAVILEPLIQGSSGMRIYSVHFLEALVRLARANDVLVIYDEVMTAWGRTGQLFAFQHSGSTPDIICLSKGLTGGVLPLGLTVVTQPIFERFLSEEKKEGFLHGHSFTGNPLACAAANASIRLFKDPLVWENIERISRRHERFVQELKDIHQVAEARAFGTILAFDIATTSSGGYFASVRDSVYQFMLERGILLRPLGNCIYLNPPYCITDNELDHVYESLLSFLKSDFLKNI
jgi:adenosylmethionine-8-amino-7-oxononanoate aminotransferase